MIIKSENSNVRVWVSSNRENNTLLIINLKLTKQINHRSEFGKLTVRVEQLLCTLWFGHFSLPNAKIDFLKGFLAETNSYL